MERQEIIPLPEEYDQKIIDYDGNMIDVMTNPKRLFIRTLADHEKKNPDAMRQVDVISIPLHDTLRLIMTIACVTHFFGGLDEKTNEVLNAIEIIARHEISQQRGQKMM